MRLPLFWRAYPALVAVVLGAVALWLVLLHRLDLQPRAIEQARQMASLVNVARAALGQVDGINRVAMLKTLAQGSAARVRVREAADQTEAFGQDEFSRRVARELSAQLGPDAQVVRRVNGVPGLWVDFSIGPDRYWLHVPPHDDDGVPQSTPWLVVLVMAMTAAGLAWVLRAVTLPLRELTQATERIRESQAQGQAQMDSRGGLDTPPRTSADPGLAVREIHDLNVGLNLMARQIERSDEERRVMLMGISHDLRTPLTRLMMDVQMSVPDAAAQAAMVEDLRQLDAIIGKFMEYARETPVKPQRVHLADLARREAAAWRHAGDLHVLVDIPTDPVVMADPTELSRVFGNVFENARRYGMTPGKAAAEVEVRARREGGWTELVIEDRGRGVAPEALGRLTVPFYRGDESRSDARGAGLGLAIVEKIVRRLGGELELSNREEGGLRLRIHLRPAP